MKNFQSILILVTLACMPLQSAYSANANSGCVNKSELISPQLLTQFKGFQEVSTYYLKSVIYGKLALKPFFTDGCTMFMDGTKEDPTLWRNCCVEHDLRYWFGGSEQQMDETDLRLQSCVKKVAGAKWAKLIYMGVRTGHHSPIKNKTQWNWGWEIPRQKAPLTPEETALVKSELAKMDVPEVDMDEFLRVNFP